MWVDDDPDSHRQVVYAIEAFADGGPNLGRPLVDRIKGSSIQNLKELRPGSAGTSEVRILFAFDPWRSSVLLSPVTSRAFGPSGIGSHPARRTAL